MKIDIHITDATPEEAALVLTGVTVSQAVGRVAAKIVQKKAEEMRPVPDPTDNDETGCKDCQNTEFDAIKCEECSPPPAPIAAVLKKKFNPPISEKKTETLDKKGVRKGIRALGLLKNRDNKYGIPKKLYSTDKRKYQRIWSRCKNQGINYEQALAQEGMEPHKKGKGYRIPFSAVSERADYQRAIRLCKKYGLPYPEALKQEQDNPMIRPPRKDKGKHRAVKPAPIVKPSAQAIAPSNDVKEPAAESKVKSKKQSGHPMKCPYCEKEINSHGAHVHMKSHGPEKYAEWVKDPDRLGTGVHRITTPHLPFHQKHDEPAVTEPHKNDPNHSSGQQAIRDLTKAQNGTLQIGRRVKHNGSKALPHYGQIGEIVGINKEELHVKFPTGDARLPSYLVLAMPEAKV